MAKETSLANLLAKELGYKDSKDLKKRLDGGSSTDISENIKGRLRSGEGFLSSFKGGLGDTSEAVAKKINPANFGKKVYKNLISGDDIFSAYLQGRGKGKKEELEGEEGTSPTAEGGGGISKDGETYLQVLAKNSMSIPWMARDLNVMRQNLIKLVKLKGGKDASTNKADAWFLKEDERETALEVQKNKIQGTKPTAVGAGTEGKGEGGGGLIDTVMQFFSGGFMKAVKFIFNPKMLGKVFSKVFVPLTIIATLFSGITAGFKRYQETGSLTDAISAGLGGMLEFVTFGLFGEDTLNSLWESVSDFFKPITESISNIFKGIKDFVKGLFPGMGGDEDTKSAEPPVPTKPDAKDFTAESKKGDSSKGPDASEAKSDKPKTSSESDTTKSTSPTPDKPSEVAATPTAVSNEAPSPSDAPVTPTPVPSGNLSTSDQIKQIEGYIDTNEKNLATREKNVKERIAAFKKAHPDEPDKVQEFTKKEQDSLDSYRKQVEEANKQHESNIKGLKPSSPTPSATATAPSAGAASSSSPSESGGSGGGSAAAVSGGGGTPPSAESASKSPSGSEIDNASTAVAEGQRMESSADAGAVVNAPSTTNNTNASGKEPTQIGDVYDSEFASLLASVA